MDFRQTDLCQIHTEDVWSLAQTSLKVKIEGQGHQGQKQHFSALLAACVRFMLGETSLGSSFNFFLKINGF